MSNGAEAGYPGSYEYEISQRVIRSEAIAHAHSKFTRALSKNAALRDEGLDESYRFTQSYVRIDGNVQRRHTRIQLLPARGVPLSEGSVSRLVLDFPTHSWAEASEHNQTMYMANVSAQQLSMAALMRMLSPERIRIPSQTIFGEAYREDGSQLCFVLGPDSLSAYSTKSDLVPSTVGTIMNDQEYGVRPTYETATLQNEMLTEWFTAEQLRDYIKDGEPFQFGGTHGTNSVAS